MFDCSTDLDWYDYWFTCFGRGYEAIRSIEILLDVLRERSLFHLHSASGKLVLGHTQIDTAIADKLRLIYTRNIFLRLAEVILDVQ
jgi:hypothetical protein